MYFSQIKYRRFSVHVVDNVLQGGRTLELIVANNLNGFDKLRDAENRAGGGLVSSFRTFLQKTKIFTRFKIV